MERDNVACKSAFCLNSSSTADENWMILLHFLLWNYVYSTYITAYKLFVKKIHRGGLLKACHIQRDRYLEQQQTGKIETEVRDT
jgi:hypothetical protein